MNEALAELRTVNVPSEHHPPCRHPLTWMRDPVNWASVPVDSTGGRRWQSEIFGLLNNWESAVRMGLGCVTAYYLKRYFWPASGESPAMAWVAPPHPTNQPTHPPPAKPWLKTWKAVPLSCTPLSSFRCWFIRSTAAWLAAWVTWTLCISSPLLPPLPYFFFLWLFYLKCV